MRILCILELVPDPLCKVLVEQRALLTCLEDWLGPKVVSRLQV